MRVLKKMFFLFFLMGEVAWGKGQEEDFLSRRISTTAELKSFCGNTLKDSWVLISGDMPVLSTLLFPAGKPGRFPKGVIVEFSFLDVASICCADIREFHGSAPGMVAGGGYLCKVK